MFILPVWLGPFSIAPLVTGTLFVDHMVFSSSDEVLRILAAVSAVMGVFSLVDVVLRICSMKAVASRVFSLEGGGVEIHSVFWCKLSLMLTKNTTLFNFEVIPRLPLRLALWKCEVPARPPSRLGLLASISSLLSHWSPREKSIKYWYVCPYTMDEGEGPVDL